MSDAINTHGIKIDFGKHRGELWTRVPVSYLNWILSEPAMATERKDIARAELERRGSKIPTILLSGHAIDRASQSCRKIWHETKQGDEGLYSWLVRVASSAVALGEKLPSGKILYMGMKFVIETEGDLPALKTVMPAKQGGK